MNSLNLLNKWAMLGSIAVLVSGCVPAPAKFEQALYERDYARAESLIQDAASFKNEERSAEDFSRQLAAAKLLDSADPTCDVLLGMYRLHEKGLREGREYQKAVDAVSRYKSIEVTQHNLFKDRQRAEISSFLVSLGYLPSVARNAAEQAADYANGYQYTMDPKDWGWAVSMRETRPSYQLQDDYYNAMRDYVGSALDKSFEHCVKNKDQRFRPYLAAEYARDLLLPQSPVRDVYRSFLAEEASAERRAVELFEQEVGSTMRPMISETCNPDSVTGQLCKQGILDQVIPVVMQVSDLAPYTDLLISQRKETEYQIAHLEAKDANAITSQAQSEQRQRESQRVMEEDRQKNNEEMMRTLGTSLGIFLGGQK